MAAAKFSKRRKNKILNILLLELLRNYLLLNHAFLSSTVILTCVFFIFILPFLPVLHLLSALSAFAKLITRLFTSSPLFSALDSRELRSPKNSLAVFTGYLPAAM